MSKRILGIDTGGTMAQAAVFDLDGHEIASDRRANQVTFPEPRHTEVDAEAMWQAACAAIRGVLEKSGTAAADIMGVSTTGHGNGLYAVDQDGHPVLPGIISTDSRAGALAAKWSTFGHGEVAEAVIMQRFWPGQTLCFLGWFKRHRPEAFDRAAALFGSKDYLRARLTGELATEITEAAVSGLASLNSGHYAYDLFETLGFGDIAAKLPPIRPSLAVGGTVTAEAPRATGLRQGTPVIRGLTDVVACAVASGVSSPDTMAVIAGIAFAHKLDIDRLRRGDDAARPTVGRLAGGVARSAVWPQIFADVLGLRIEVPSCTELGAQGAALSVATALGLYPSLEEAVRHLVKIARRYEPDATRHAAYERSLPVLPPSQPRWQQPNPYLTPPDTARRRPDAGHGDSPYESRIVAGSQRHGAPRRARPDARAGRSDRQGSRRHGLRDRHPHLPRTQDGGRAVPFGHWP